MNTKHQFRNKYRISSARLAGYDYSQNGAYFVTICTRNWEHFFGEIVNREMRWSEMGAIACRCWEDIPGHFPFVNLGKWVVMPNHVHGVIVIDKTAVSPSVAVETQNAAVETQNAVVETQNIASLRQTQNAAVETQNIAVETQNIAVETQNIAVETQNIASLRRPTTGTGNQFGPQSGNLASIVRGFKIGVTKYARQNTDIFDVWQPRFHDRIIRDENELRRISEYISANPHNWENDRYFEKP